MAVTHSLGSYVHHIVDISLPSSHPSDASDYVILHLGQNTYRLTEADFQGVFNCMSAAHRRLFGARPPIDRPQDD